ncbi:SDR family NAD(P)-dependent oxidoreductase [Acidisoma cellulosilytica]|uniref:SDR family NAD(P)-dependent oxidoreductase n=1 Tax=Acidisoma cellulosilyticum TaxID=2802395 RepID=A0A963Z4T8_9PROT|nr:SDR family NAD(P)-dependent oxidoreductase [Acidisoma cellulosilyticum]MCB8882880.1 SDR family NAD(P)-dependent oxidoreductase [Acidisoma cellulosilyticum]
MTVLVTGAAGFIGYHVCEALLARGETVIGVDEINAYYDPALKHARLARLEGREGFRFVKLSIADRAAVEALMAGAPEIDRIVHLAAQAGVRFSMLDPYAYVTANLLGHVVMLEAARHREGLKHFVYASSSSVYGGNTKMPFSEEDRVDLPVSLYGATKRADELMSHSYSHLYGLKQSGLRFFTVYGPWGRPDMAYFSFAQAITQGKPITLYDNGTLRRDFTYIDDIVAGILGVLDRPPAGDAPRLLNIGNNQSETVSKLVSLLEEGLGRKAVVIDQPRPAADVTDTFADISEIRALTGFSPTTPLELGIPRFIDWYKGWNGR